MANISGAMKKDMAEFNKSVLQSSVDRTAGPIKQLNAASSKTRDGSVTAVFEADWKFVVTAYIERSEIEQLDEEGLRRILGGLVDEVAAQTGAEDGIEIGNLIEVRDGETEEIIEGTVEPTTKTYAVVGRIPGDDEDSCYTFSAKSREKAIEMFDAALYDDSGLDEGHRTRNIVGHGCSVFINHVLVSDTPIETL